MDRLPENSTSEEQLHHSDQDSDTSVSLALWYIYNWPMLYDRTITQVEIVNEPRESACVSDEIIDYSRSFMPAGILHLPFDFDYSLKISKVS